MTSAPPPEAPQVHPLALWLGPRAARSDASIIAGALWFAALMAALRAGSATFGMLMAAVAAVGGWQAASTGDQRLRLPAAALAAAVGTAGVFDTRLAGVVLGASIIASFIVVAALRRDRAPADATRPRALMPQLLLARSGLLIRCWMHVGVAAVCAASVARHSRGAALMLAAVAACYDAGSYLTAADRRPGLSGPVAGAVAAAAAVFALTGLSVPPFAPDDALRFGVMAALTLPLGPALARTIAGSGPGPVALLTAARSRAHPANSSSPLRAEPTDRPPPALQRLHSRLVSPWAVRRLDSLSITAPVWMWGLGLLSI